MTPKQTDQTCTLSIANAMTESIHRGHFKLSGYQARLSVENTLPKGIGCGDRYSKAKQWLLVAAILIRTSAPTSNSEACWGARFRWPFERSGLRSSFERAGNRSEDGWQQSC